MGQLRCFHLFSLLFVGKLAFFNRPRPFFYPFWLDHLTFFTNLIRVILDNIYVSN